MNYQKPVTIQQFFFKEFAILEELLNKKTTKKILRRSQDTKKAFLTHEEMLELIDSIL